MKKLITLILLVAFGFIGFAVQKGIKSTKLKENKTSEVEFRTGDLVFQDSESSQSKAIKLATQSEFSHVGIIIMKDDVPYVLEAVEPVRMIPFSSWKNNGSRGEYTLSRLKNPVKMDKNKLENFTKTHLNKHYDLGFYWTDEKMYCSELAFKFYRDVTGIELCDKHQLKEYSTDYPEVRRIMKQRYGNNIPWDEWMVSPEDLFKSDLMIKIR